MANVRRKNKSKIFLIIKQHVINNKKEYIIISILFVLGIFVGVFFVNNVQEATRVEITEYFNNFTTKLKDTNELNQLELLKSTVLEKIVLVAIIWFFGTTVIGIPVVFGLVIYRGFCLGYTISICITIMGFSKGIVFVLISLLLQNLLFIPAILALGVSGFKLYKSIIKDNRKENIKIEIVRHTIFSLIMMIVLIISSVIEILLSTNLLRICAKYF